MSDDAVLSPEDNIDPNFYDSDISDLDDNEEGLESLEPEEETEPEWYPSDEDFRANLAEELDDKKLDDLALELLEDIKNDKDARADWENTIDLALRYLGHKVEEGRQQPFINACAAFDTTLSKQLIGAYSIFRAELFPAAGPCAGKVVGIETKEKQDRAERIELFVNNYLTKIDRPYYPDSEQLIIYTIFCGSAFRKVYPDPQDGRPLARMIKPQDFIVNPDATDLTSATRMTQALTYTRKEILQLEDTGFYKKGSLPLKDSESEDEDDSRINKTVDRMDGIQKTNDEKMSIRYYECHVELDPNEIEMGIYKKKDDEESYRPYIITICAESKKIAAIRRGWVENSPTFKKEVYFNNYYYIKGFGIYGLGLAHLMGSNSIVLTSTLRQLIDSATLKNFPALIMAKGAREENNNVALGPGEVKEIDTAGAPIRDIIMNLPYAGADPGLMQLRNELMEQCGGVGAAAQGDIPDAGINAPVGTTLALLEVNNRVMATVLRSFHTSLSYELELLYNLFGKWLPEQPYPFAVPGKESAVMRSDFNDSVNITPVSDPNMMMKAHRLIQAEVQMNLAEKHPELHNMREVYVRVYAAMSVEDVDAILPPPPKPIPLDAISENMNIMAGKGVTASMNQDHDAHILLHNNVAQLLMQMQNIPFYVIAMSHIQVHKAFKLILQSQELQQMLMPAQEQWSKDPHILLTIPQIQYAIDSQDAQEEHQKQEQAKQQASSQPQPIDPSMVMLEEVKVKQESNSIRLEETKIKSDTELRVNEMKSQTEREKMELQMLLAQEKQKFDLLVEQMKLDQQMEKTHLLQQSKGVLP